MDDMSGMSGMSGTLPAMDWQSLTTHWELRPVWTALVAVALVAYLVGVARLRSGHAHDGAPGGAPGAVHPGRVACFVTGLVLLLVSVSSGVEVYASTVFWMHMVQHLMLIMVVPAMLVLGSPLTVLVRATPGTWAARVLVSGPVSLLTHPITGFAVYAVVIVETHLTGFMDQMMTTSWLAPFEQALYLLGGYLFLLPLVGDEPIRWHPPQLLRVFLLIIGMVPDTIVGIVLLQSGRNLFPAMLGGDHPWAPDPVTDIHVAGGLMWALGDGLMMVIAVAKVVSLLARPDRGDLVGSYLEGVRRSTMQHHVTRSQGDATQIGTDSDVDDDDAVLAAYNAMLGRMGGDRSR